MKKKLVAIGLAAAVMAVGVGALAGCGETADGSVINKAISREAGSGTRGAFEELVKGSDGTTDLLYRGQRRGVSCRMRWQHGKICPPDCRRCTLRYGYAACRSACDRGDGRHAAGARVSHALCAHGGMRFRFPARYCALLCTREGNSVYILSDSGKRGRLRFRRCCDDMAFAETYISCGTAGCPVCRR